MTPLQANELNEQHLLAYAFTDSQVIDRATQAGVTAECFVKPEHHYIWRLLCELRLAGRNTDSGTFIQEAVAQGRIGPMGGIPFVFETADLGTASPGGSGPCIDRILEVHAKRQSYKLLLGAVEQLKDGGGDLDVVRETVERVAGIAAGNARVQRGINEIDDEVAAQVEAARSGKADDGRVISWGLPKLDKYMLPIERHEYALICARPSRGKSSMLTHLAGHNLKLGKRVVIFTLETSDKAVFMQLAAQWCRLNLKEMRAWFPEDYKKFNEARAYIRNSKRLLIFDKDMTLAQIEARCRLLAASFKPDLVAGDYLGLVRTSGKDLYERVSNVSKAMIPLRKVVDCPLVWGQQLKRMENEGKEPTLADLRDSGQLEEDAHRVVMLHWTESQYLDQENRPYKILQPKLRDGPTTAVTGITFHAPTTTFREATL